MMKIFLVFCSILLSACSSVGLNKTAIFENEYPGDGYLIVVSGRQALMAHDPISSIVNGSYRSECHIRLNSMQGTVDASDVQIIQLDDFGASKKVHLVEGAVGMLVFTKDTLLINIKVPNALTPSNGLQPYSFNGNYALIRAGSQ